MGDLVVLAFFVNTIGGAPRKCSPQMQPLENAWAVEAIEKCTDRRPGVAVFGWNNRFCIKDVTTEKLIEQTVKLIDDYNPRNIHIDFLPHAELQNGMPPSEILEGMKKMEDYIKALREQRPDTAVVLSFNVHYYENSEVFKAYPEGDALDLKHLVNAVKDLVWFVDPLHYGADTSNVIGGSDLPKATSKATLLKNAGVMSCVGVEGDKLTAGGTKALAAAAIQEKTRCFTFWKTETQGAKPEDGMDWPSLMRKFWYDKVEDTLIIPSNGNGGNPVSGPGSDSGNGGENPAVVGCF